jgi:aminopeptidase N
VTHDDATSTYDWFISTPVNNYGVSVSIAPYRLIEEPYRSVTGETFPFQFWVLPEHYQEGLRVFPQFKRHMRFFEETLGPYPFRIDKYGVAESPYLGMEHQSIIAYGSDFTDNEAGFDGLHFHELSHEWWANMVTAADWKDWWLHESFGSYMEALYAEYLNGTQAYHEYIPDRVTSTARANGSSTRSATSSAGTRCSSRCAGWRIRIRLRRPRRAVDAAWPQPANSEISLSRSRGWSSTGSSTPTYTHPRSRGSLPNGTTT